MADRGPSDDDDQAWLLARERGEPGPTISEAHAGQYAQLGTLIASLPPLPAGTAERRGWEQSVLAVIDAEIGRPPDQRGTSPAATDDTLPKGTTATRRHRRRAATVTAAVFVVAAGVAIVFLVRGDRRDQAPLRTSALDVDAEPRGRTGSADRATEVTRGMHVEQGRLGFDHAIQVRSSTTAVPHELHDGDTVMTGDRLRASVVTSADAYVVLAFCAGQQLQIYPPRRGVHTRAGDLVLLPEGDGELVLDSHPGPELLYLIVSRNELSRADPQLAAALGGTAEGARAVDCGSSLDDRLMKTAPEADGIAIVRYRFNHVARQHD